MSGKIKILDCTLRDGGRCFGNTWGDENINSISKGLSEANIDIVEIGFLWFLSEGICRENTTVFRSINETKQFLNIGQEYAAYIEYVLYKKENHILPVCDGSVKYIRLGILKDEIDESNSFMKEICDKGYKLFVQGINIMSYTEKELVEYIEKINKVKPYAFAIVDTFGSMYIKDIKRIFKLVDKYLDKDISVALHSHNNMQLSLALAMTLIEIHGDRDIIIDGTLNGIGMGAGNLSTELICKYINDNESGNYNLDSIVNILDKHIEKFKNKFQWDSSLLSYESARRWVGQINLSYIKNEYREIGLKEQRMLLNMFQAGKGVPPHKIDNLYRILSYKTDNTENSIENLANKISNRKILVVGKGPSVIQEKEKIQKYIDTNIPIIFYINHIDKIYSSKDEDYYWYIDKEKYKAHLEKYSGKNVITLECIGNDAEYILNYKELQYNNLSSGDSIIIILMLLTHIENINNVMIAGMDGTNATNLQILETKKILKEIRNKIEINFLTDSKYS